MRFSKQFDTFVGAGITNPTLTFDVPVALRCGVRFAALLLALLALLACGPPRAAPVVQAPPPVVSRLLPPPAIDPSTRGAAYLTAVALSLQPAWHSFLEDCRLRLRATHPLNDMDRSALASIVIGKRGELIAFKVSQQERKPPAQPSVDFDHAIEHVIRDASPFPVPPRELWSDDDTVTLEWRFFRDRRQAGPATASLRHVQLPLDEVVDRMIGEHDLARAARRIARDGKQSVIREIATQHLMIATLREALASSDAAVQREALEAVATANATELAMEVRQVLLANASDVDLRLAAIETAAVLLDEDAISPLFDQLRFDGEPRVALATVRVLTFLGAPTKATPYLAEQLSRPTPNPTAIQALAIAPIAELAPMLDVWFRSPSARTRAATCTALAAYAEPNATALVERGLRDRDAMVRASCAQSAAGAVHAKSLKPPMKKRLLELTRDRDSAVRAQAYVAIALIEPAKLASAVNDAASEVRAAYARAISIAKPTAGERELRSLVQDRDPEVRAAAWKEFAAHPSRPTGRADIAARAADDPAPQVRLAAVPAIEDEDVLLRLAKTDVARDVRTAALVHFAKRRGRERSSALLIERLADAPPASSERVRAALAWLVARSPSP